MSFLDNHIFILIGLFMTLVSGWVSLKNCLFIRVLEAECKHEKFFRFFLEYASIYNYFFNQSTKFWKKT